MYDHIDTFLQRVARDRADYEAVAAHCSRLLDAALRRDGIRALVSARVKAPDSLAAKVRARHERAAYGSPEDIVADIVDLVGIRIALYFPGDQGRVDAVIHRSFDLCSPRDPAHPNPKTFPAEGPHPARPMFPGYKAVHYRITRKPELHDETGTSIPRDQPIEIQVASILMHNWAEVEHDLAYKPHTGDLSPQERVLLDQINGLVLSAELALSLLQQAQTERIAAATTPFANAYELALYLMKLFPDHVGQEEYVDELDERLGGTDMLLDMLREIGLDTPTGLSQHLADFAPRDTTYAAFDRGVNRTLVRIMRPHDKADGPVPLVKQIVLHLNDKSGVIANAYLRLVFAAAPHLIEPVVTDVRHHLRLDDETQRRLPEELAVWVDAVSGLLADIEANEATTQASGSGS